MRNKIIALGLIGLGLLASAVRADILLSDTFSYPDGLLVNVSGGKWVKHSGTGNDFYVTNGQIQIFQTRFDDVNSALRGGPYLPASTSLVVYASFDVAFSQLPTNGYFAHFKDGATLFRAKIYATTNGATEGSLRIGVANAANTVNAVIPSDVNRDSTNKLVLRYNINTASTTIWLNPSAESDTGYTAADSTTVATVLAFAFRQNSGEGAMTVDNLIVATTFAEVIAPPPADPPIFLTQPLPQTALAGATVAFSVLAAGSAPLSYQWQKNGTDLTDGGNISGSTTTNLTLSNVTTDDSGNYSVTVTNPAGPTNSQTVLLTVTNALQAPSIITPPQDQTVQVGSSATFFVEAGGSAPLFYQWIFYGTNLPGQTGTNLVLSSVQTAQAGTYSVMVSNSAGFTNREATLTVTLPPPVTTNIAYLHTLVNTNTYALTNTTTYFTVQGTVTTHANLTSSSGALFYIQDSSGGVAVYWAGGAANLPPAGALVQVTAKLTQYQGLIEISPSASDPASSVTIISTGNPLPTPQPVPFATALQTDPAHMSPLVGSYLVASNVFLDLTSSNFAYVSSGEQITNSLGETFTLFINNYTDIVGQKKPAGPVTILGVLGQYKTSSPYTSGYQLIPSRYADIISPSLPPVVVFTNYLSNLTRAGEQLTNKYSESVLRPSETLEMQTVIYDADGLVVNIQPLPGTLPPNAGWTLGPTSGTRLSATFQFTPTVADAGSNFVVVLRAWSTKGTNDQTWNIYVPTAQEQKIYLSEFFPNPTSDTNSPMFNPLRRSPPLTNNIGLADQFVEIANLSSTEVDLYNWTIADAVKMRHKFYNGSYGYPPEAIGSSNAVIVYGGPLNGFAPNLPVYAYPTSEDPNNQGLALNRTGTETIILRNADGHIVDRVFYFGSDLSPLGSLSRFPTLNGAFVPQAFVGGTNVVSPGLQFDGFPFNQPAPALAGVSNVMITTPTSKTVQLDWTAVPGVAYTLWQSPIIAQPFRVFSGASFTNTTGQFIDNTTNAPARFYYITTP